jgi:hypothetical protein
MRSIWDRSSGQRRRRVRRFAIAIAAMGVGAVAVGYWTESWPFATRSPPIDLAATAAPKDWVDPPEATRSEDPGPAPEETGPPPDLPETNPAPATVLLAEAAEGELRALRSGGAETLWRKVGALAVDARYGREARAGWVAEARELAKRVVFSATPMTHAAMVPVKHGDTLLGLCARLRREDKATVTPRFVEMVNDVSAKRLRAGITLKVPTERMSVLVDKDEFRLYVLLGGCMIRDYEIGTGRGERTPEGRFVIDSKTKQPEWTDSETGKVYRFGEPGHLIGSRWMGFAGSHGKTGFGIHGTVEPETIGRAESAGCIRMRKDDVEELFDLIPQGSDVLIRR